MPSSSPSRRFGATLIAEAERVTESDDLAEVAAWVLELGLHLVNGQTNKARAMVNRSQRRASSTDDVQSRPSRRRTHPRLVRLCEFHRHYPDFTRNRMRHLRFHCEEFGLSDAFSQVGRAVWVDPERLFELLTQHQRRRA
ncbi:MAG: hypothetical protein AAGN66_26965 [Acidobacteriota bacterium]